MLFKYSGENISRWVEANTDISARVSHASRGWFQSAFGLVEADGLLIHSRICRIIAGMCSHTQRRTRNDYSGAERSPRNDSGTVILQLCIAMQVLIHHLCGIWNTCVPPFLETPVYTMQIRTWNGDFILHFSGGKMALELRIRSTSFPVTSSQSLSSPPSLMSFPLF